MYEKLNECGKYKLPPTLKDKQLEVVTSVLNKADTFAMLPNEYGKSLTYALPPLLWNGRLLYTKYQS